MAAEKTRISLKCDEKELLKDDNVHFIPCKFDPDNKENIGSDAKSDRIKNFFHSSIFCEKNDNGSYEDVLHASIRGRPLVGTRMKLPQGYEGIVLEKEEHSEEEEHKNYKIREKFKSLTYWNLDSKPNLDDKFRQALKWIEISKAVNLFSVFFFRIFLLTVILINILYTIE
ncbi:hypothetical protein HELRODRAFT_161934 [Helobdella robusta]|uniref:Uncharacterized protein n=1 Tax=Helobdella robusta TaxID=6412 RepID=T1ES19_HELRO|nr:hypothetical protein HELRODRAFT_161934 [Helobdella robusta]ESO02644.1 hypothetical protein HELRODRAFT_161934 [Helobdella robusta]